MMFDHVLFLAPEVPFKADNGMKIGILSDLFSIEAVAGRVTMLCSALDSDGPPVESSRRRVVVIKKQSGNRFMRVLRGLPTEYPFSIARIYTGDGFRAARSVCDDAFDLIFIGDQSMYGYADIVRRAQPGARVIMRSNNYNSGMSAANALRLPIWQRPIGIIESRRWRESERKAMRLCNENWSITEKERIQFTAFAPEVRTRHVPIGVDVSRYSELPISNRNPYRFVHVGTIDLRRIDDVEWFVEGPWTLVSDRLKDAEATFAGGVTVDVKDGLRQQVKFVGKIKDDVDIYRHSRFALNVQRSPGGIKIKSITAMAAGCTLLSTTEGVQGMNVQHGVHYWNLERLLEEDALPAAIEDDSRNAEIARKGRAFVLEQHSLDTAKHKVSTALAECLYGV